ncbi:MAG: protein kinase [Polyangiaceae bacterium]
MSPEQLESPRDVDYRADIWALGIILYELLVGRTPFHGNTLAIVHARILVGKYEAPSKLQPELPPEIDEIVARCLQHSVDARFPTVAHLAIALEGPAQDRMHEIVASTVRIIAASRLATPISTSPWLQLPAAFDPLGAARGPCERSHPRGHSQQRRSLHGQRLRLRQPRRAHLSAGGGELRGCSRHLGRAASGPKRHAGDHRQRG